MKKWLVSAIFVVALLVSLPFWVGILAQWGLHQREANINQNFGNTLAMEITEYHRGWFSSTAKVKVTIQAKKLSDDLLKVLTPLLANQATAQPEFFSINYDVKITHGPVILDQLDGKSRLQFGLASLNGDCNLPWNAQTRQTMTRILGTQPLYQINSLVHFTGGTTTRVQSAKVNYESKADDLQIAWTGLSLDVQASKKLDKLTLNMAIAPLKAGTYNASNLVTSSKVSMIANIRRGIEDLWFGQVEFNLHNLDVVLNGQQALNVKDIKINSQQALQNSKVNTTLKYTIADIVASQEQYGPTELSLALNQFNAKQLRSVTDLVNKNNLQVMTKPQLVYFGMQLMPDLLRMVDGASIQLSFTTKAPQGAIKANLVVDTAKQGGEHIDPLAFARGSQGSLQVVAPKYVVIAILADNIKEQLLQESLQNAVRTGAALDVASISVAAKAKVKQQLEKYVGDGWIMDDQDNYKTDFHYQEGKLIANGVTKFDFLNPNANQVTLTPAPAVH